MREVFRFTVGFRVRLTASFSVVLTPFTSEPVPQEIINALVDAAEHFTRRLGEVSVTVDEDGDLRGTVNVNPDSDRRFFNQLLRCARRGAEVWMNFRENFPRAGIDASVGKVIANFGSGFVIRVLTHRSIRVAESRRVDKEIYLSPRAESGFLIVAVRSDLWRESPWMGFAFASELEVSLWLAVNYIVADEWSANRFAPQQYLY